MRLGILVAAFLAPVCACAIAETPATDGDAVPDGPVLRVAPLPDSHSVDGLLDEPAWAEAPAIGNLTMVDPVAGGEPGRRTVVKALAGRDALVFGILCHHDTPDEIVSWSMGKDVDFSGQDHIHLVLGPFRDGRSGYVFTISPTGARRDGLVTARGEAEDTNWDGIWEARATRTPEGWSAEVRIPSATIGFREGLDAWHFNVERYIACLNETDRWAAVSRNFAITHTGRAGLLAGLPALDQGLGLSLRPSLVGRVGSEARGEPALSDLEPSLDATQRLGPELLASLTVNTDFAETEVDARQVNLTRFPLFFPEKRSFFLEGADYFDFGLGPSPDVYAFYSRRIGLVDGQEVPLVAGAKLHGRLGGTSVGMLGVRTGAESDVAPAAWMGVARVKQDILEESTVGMIASAGDPLGRSGAWLAGGDFTYQTTRFQGDKNFLVGLWGLTTGRDDLEGGSRSALGAKIDFPNDLWDIALYYKRVGEDFDPSLGFVPRPGIQRVECNVTYSPRPESLPFIREMHYVTKGYCVTDLDGRWETYHASLSPLSWDLQEGDGVALTLMPHGERLDAPFEIDDGVTIPAGEYHWTRAWAGGWTSSRRPVSGSVGAGAGGFYDGTLTEVEAGLTVRFEPLLTLSVSGETNIVRLPDGDFTRDLVAARAALLFSPDLDLSSYVQYDTDSRPLGTNTRLHWEATPVADVFLVFNYNAGRWDGVWERDGFEVMLKVQYTFRP